MDSKVRAMTWNVWWRFGPRWRDRQPAILATLKRCDPDVVALQEVWRDAETTQADELAGELGMHALYAEPSYPPAPTGTGKRTSRESVSGSPCSAAGLCSTTRPW